MWNECPTEPIIADREGVVDYNPPHVSDNSGKVHNYTVFPPIYPPQSITGPLDVFYTAFDEFGNYATCIVELRYVGQSNSNFFVN